MKAKNQQPFFAHEASSRNSDKIIRLRMKHGVAGYGAYYMLLERLRSSETFQSDLDYDVLAFDLKCEKQLIKSVIEDFELFEIIDDGRKFHSYELTEKMEVMMEAKKRRQEAARKAAEARWNRYFDRSKDDSEQDPSQDSDPADIPDYDDNTPLRPNGGIENEITILKNDKDWKKAIINEFGFSDEEFLNHMEEFQSSCIGNGQKDGHVNMVDAAKHCRAFFRKLRTSRENLKSQSTGTTTSPVSDRLSKLETQRLKEFNKRCEEKHKENQEVSKNVSQSGDNVYRNFGYQPKACFIMNLFDPQWRKHNPPPHPEWIGRFTGRQTVEEVEAQLQLEAVGG